MCLDSLRWDLLRIFDELKSGLGKIAARGIKVESLSCDSWGVDYVLLRGDEPMLTLPYHYRDARTDGGLERANARGPVGSDLCRDGHPVHDDQHLVSTPRRSGATSRGR